MSSSLPFARACHSGFCADKAEMTVCAESVLPLCSGTSRSMKYQERPSRSERHEVASDGCGSPLAFSVTRRSHTLLRIRSRSSARAAFGSSVMSNELIAPRISTRRVPPKCGRVAGHASAPRLSAAASSKKVRFITSGWGYSDRNRLLTVRGSL